MSIKLLSLIDLKFMYKVNQKNTNSIPPEWRTYPSMKKWTKKKNKMAVCHISGVYSLAMTNSWHAFISMAINSPNPIIPNDERMNSQLLPGSKLRVTIEKGVRVATMRFIDANPCPIIGLSSNSLILSFHSASRD